MTPIIWRSEPRFYPDSCDDVEMDLRSGGSVAGTSCFRFAFFVINQSRWPLTSLLAFIYIL